jgi:hypothetical protein
MLLLSFLLLRISAVIAFFGLFLKRSKIVLLHAIKFESNFSWGDLRAMTQSGRRKVAKRRIDEEALSRGIVEKAKVRKNLK